MGRFMLGLKEGRGLQGEMKRDKILKAKKGIRGLPDNFVKRFSNLDFKTARKMMHDVYGVFKEKGFEKRMKLLERIKGMDDKEGHLSILKLHKSSKERIQYYGFVYRKIFGITGKPSSIIDVGCGLNPLSIPFMGPDKEGLRYCALELTEEDAGFLQAYFDKMGINGTAVALDLLDLNEVKEFCRRKGRSDVCFMFKLLDTLETEEQGISKWLIEAVDAKWVAASFSTRTLGGKGRISEKRLVWFRRLIEGFRCFEFDIMNEKFFVCSKSENP
ncbi:hypothetical protein HZB88_01155 [archaeon]|nr:hypothetical protein [archaeon]